MRAHWRHLANTTELMLPLAHPSPQQKWHVDRLSHFLVTVCKMVRAMLSGRCPVCLSVALVYCGQMIGWIKTKLGTEEGLSPGHIMLDGDTAPPQKGHSHPQFSAHAHCGQTAGWMKMPRGTEVDLSPGDIVLDGDPAPPPQKGGTAAPQL